MLTLPKVISTYRNIILRRYAEWHGSHSDDSCKELSRVSQRDWSLAVSHCCISAMHILLYKAAVLSARQHKIEPWLEVARTESPNRFRT